MNTRLRTNQNFEEDFMDDKPSLEEMSKVEYPDVGTGRYAIKMLEKAVAAMLSGNYFERAQVLDELGVEWHN